MWFAGVDLAGLPGLPASDRSIRRMAQRENWRSRDRQGRGGGKEYHISSLPLETQQCLLTGAAADPSAGIQNFSNREATDLLNNTELIAPISPLDVQNFASRQDESPSPKFESQIPEPAEDQDLPENLDILRIANNPLVTPIAVVGSEDRMRANLEIQIAFEQFVRNCCDPAGIKKVDCEYRFCQLYGMREITFPREADVYRFFPKISRSKLCRDRKILQEQGTQALGGNYGNRRGQSKVTPEMQSVILALITRDTTFIHGELAKRFEKIPSMSTLNRWVNAWRLSHLQEYTLLVSKNRFNSKFRAAYGDADGGITQVNQRWEIDATKGDIILADGKRHCLLRVIDIYSRRIKTFVSPTVNSSDYLQGLLYKAFIDWGIPEELRTDKGLAETSSLVAMAMLDLGIRQHICNAFSPWEKPFVERSLNTRALLSQLPGFCGANVAERQKIREQGGLDVEIRLTVEQLQQEIDKWTISYENRPHRGFDGTDREGKSPIEAWTGSPGIIRKISSEREKQALSLLLSEVPHGGGVRVVQKSGIQIGKNWFADAAGEWVMHIGRSVLCKYSPCGDAGVIHVFEFADNGGIGRYLFTATCAELVGEDRAEKAQRAKEKQQTIRASARELRKLAKNIAGEKLPEVSMGQVVPFPLPSEEFASIALEAATAAVEAAIPVAAPQPTQEELQAIALERQRLEERANQAPEEEPGDRYRRLWFRRQGGDEILETDQRFMDRFESLTQGRVMKQILESGVDRHA